ncbi:UDP-N-acetylmuramate dehydrogenase [Ethanoligenens harbinense]|nr:UDP-N-acetylenolpyruvoylglucosamine reductase [Ethanoligenens harbinense YUAN-3]QCN93654.1 UDP-N-acetylmuramate dehydrogenase [Ethanoligenens harbinense]
MSRHTTFQIGGPARLFIRPHEEQVLGAIVGLCAKLGIPVLPLGNGSNLLIADDGFDGTVVSLERLSALQVDGNGIRCGAGVKLEDVCLFARDHGLAGLEFAYGIPGTAGGAVYMNAGAYGGEMRDVVDRSWYLDGAVQGVYMRGEHAFSYRHSIYTNSRKVVTGVRFALVPGDKAQIGRKMQELMDRRVSKQPLEYPSAGSVFKRPPGHFAGTLIDQCGLKGTSVGGAAVSDKHAGFIVNMGGATCADVVALIRQIQAAVLQKTGVKLESEIRIIGGGH